MSKKQRIRDIVHDLVEFDGGKFEQMLWEVISSKEFQRLRRIKQLGFSDLTYPSASHTRFAHSIGVFHIARQMVELISKMRIDRTDDEIKEDKKKGEIAMAAALVHDVGHGPFSHSFESVIKEIDTKKNHEIWSQEIIEGDTEINKIFNLYEDGFATSVANLLKNEVPIDIYGSIVSSQFDADRMDYLRRDRILTGVKQAEFDYSWLMANLKIVRVKCYSDDGETELEVDAFAVGKKSPQAAEGYLLGLFHMYFMVYFHKATRSAEQLNKFLLLRLDELIREKKLSYTGLTKKNGIVNFFSTKSLDNYLNLDDSVFWASYHRMKNAKDPIIKRLASCLIDRKLYKSVEIKVDYGENPQKNDLFVENLEKIFKKKIEDGVFGKFGKYEVFVDAVLRDPYKSKYEGGAMLRVLIEDDSHDDGYVDIKEKLTLVDALRKKWVCRIFYYDKKHLENINSIVENLRKGLG